MRKPVYEICAQQRRKSASAQSDKHLCFHYLDSTIPILAKSKISRLYLASEAEQAGLSLNLVENPEDRFSHCEAHINYRKITIWEP